MLGLGHWRLVILKTRWVLIEFPSFTLPANLGISTKTDVRWTFHPKLPGEGLLNISLDRKEQRKGRREREKDIMQAEFTGGRRGHVHPYLGPNWAEQHRRASRCTEAEPL